MIAHSPLGGPRRAGGLARQDALAQIAAAHAASAAEVALAWARDLSPALIPIPGARRPETARSAARAAALVLDDVDRRLLARSLGWPRPPQVGRPATRVDAEVVLVMGIPGAGKTRVAEEYVGRGYHRLNRDERGGTLRELAHALGDELSSGISRVVLDNTYLTPRIPEPRRRGRGTTRHADPLRLARDAARAGPGQPRRAFARPPRLASYAGRAEAARTTRAGPDDADVADARAPRTRASVASTRASPKSSTAFARAPRAGRGRGVFVAAAVLGAPGWKAPSSSVDPGAPHLVFDWRPDGRHGVLTERSHSSRRVVAGLSTPRFAPTLPARRSAGAARRFPDSRSPSRGQRRRPGTLDFIGSSPAHRRLRRPSAAATSRSEGRRLAPRDRLKPLQSGDSSGGEASICRGGRAPTIAARAQGGDVTGGRNVSRGRSGPLVFDRGGR